MLFSIVIPTLNEENYIQHTITCIKNNFTGDWEFEIIVVDAGSKDDTVEISNQLANQVLVRPNFQGKKYASLNEGAKQASGKFLIFLDADTLLPKGFDEEILQIFSDERNVAGAFPMKFDSGGISYKLIELINRIRYGVSQEYYGDQALFCRKKSFFEVGMYPQRLILESAHLCNALKRKGRLRLAKSKVVTSNRRFKKGRLPPFSVLWLDAKIFLLDKFGKDTDQYAIDYWEKNTE